MKVWVLAVRQRKLKHEFEEFGPIKRIRLVHDRNAGEILRSSAVYTQCFGFETAHIRNI
jgi:RNA recognition motif-containing protein